MSLTINPHDQGYYMPHHAVFKEASKTTKVRVVFDASAKASNGASLNETLMIGPTIQDKLNSHILLLRTYPYILIADIEKMYRQVRLHEDDRRYQKILWRVNGKIEAFQLNTLTFGVSSSPFLAIRTLHQLAEDERQIYPRAAEIILKHLYVDDLLSGADTIAEARAIRDELVALLKRDGFSIRQWTSNDKRILNDLDSQAIHANFVLNADRSLKTLGVAWCARDDKIHYYFRPVKHADQMTKRTILSEIAKIFDPIGLLGPITLWTRSLMQSVWRSQVHWDESVPQAIYTEWSTFVRQLETLDRISFDRNMCLNDHTNIQIHGFCDASNQGYGACLYARSRGKGGKVAVRLLCSRSRVAPLKGMINIPKLELCGALLLTQLYQDSISALRFTPNKTIFWCDSTIVLHWLKTSPHLLRVFVANRVAEIQRCAGIDSWRHVRSECNPADALSRGQLPHDFLQNSLWAQGPAWLSREDSQWPDNVMPTVVLPELKRSTCLVTMTKEFNFYERCTSYSKLISAIAHCLRIPPKRKQRYGPLTADELKAAEFKILKLIPATRFSKLIKAITAGEHSGYAGYANLCPFIDDDGLIRVGGGGRLQQSEFTFTQKHPILLPSCHRVTDSLIRELHQRHFHTGIQTTLYLLRQKFWLTDGRNQVRRVIRACTKCFRFQAKAVEYMIGNQPPARVRQSVPFTHTGVDFCGPFFIKEKKYRNRNRIKVYICVFVCLAIKAIHLEVVSDLTTDAFLDAFRRFAARRGLPEHVYSDNATNFVGANNQLKDLYCLLNSTEHRDAVNRFATERRITWHFIPPAAPHFGGLWEASVKIFKHHFKRVVGDTLFTFEELNTFVIEVEGILNSRPITSISSDPLALTPAHYLIGRPLTTLPEGDLSSVPENRLSTWQHICKVRHDFWARWHLEYLNELQTRAKWSKNGPGIEIGTVVLIKDNHLPCSQWALGRISDLHTGQDGIAQAAVIRTSSGEIKRPVNRLCPLPIEQ